MAATPLGAFQNAPILHLICDHIALPRDLYALVRVNHTFHAILSRRLDRLLLKWNPNQLGHNYTRYTSYDNTMDKAVSWGWAALVRRLIDVGFDVKGEPPKPGGSTLLHRASADGRAPRAHIAKYLIEAGADVNATTNGGSTPLHWLSQRDDDKLVDVLITHGADLDARDGCGRTPLHYCASNGNADAVELLLKHGAEVDARDKEGRTPLYQAACGEMHPSSVYKRVAELLLQYGADISMTNNSGSTPLMRSLAGYYKPEFCRLLLENGADPNVIASYGWRPIHHAASEIAGIDLLLSMGADPNLRDKDGATALHIAVRRSSIYAVRQLLDHGGDLSVLDDKGVSVLDVAFEVGSEMLRPLLQLANKSILDAHSHTPLHFAAYSGNLEDFRAALEHYNNVWVKNKWGCTPLHEAAENDQADIIRYILETCFKNDVAGDNSFNNFVEAANDDGQTALHIAANHGSEKAVEMLLPHGRSRDIADKDNDKPLAMAASQGHVNVVKLFLENGIDWFDRWDAAKAAAENEYSNVVHLLGLYDAFYSPADDSTSSSEAGEGEDVAGEETPKHQDAQVVLTE